MTTTDYEDLHSIKDQIKHDLNDVKNQLRHAFEDRPRTVLDKAFYVPELMVLFIPGCSRFLMGMQHFKESILAKDPKYVLDEKHRDARAAARISAAVNKLEMIEDRLKVNAEHFHKEIADVRFQINFFGGVVTQIEERYMNKLYE